MAGASKPRKSSRDVARRAAHGEVGARLECWSIDEVESSLREIQLQGSETSLLSRLQSPNSNKADVVKEVLEQMSDHAEEHAMWMALVWRYAKEHEVWNSCQNPIWRTEDAFLDSMVGHQTVRICIQFGRSTDVARRGKMNIIRRNWGEGWYQEACERTLLPQGARGAAGLSKRLLAKIAELSSLVSLDDALGLWDKAIQERVTVGSRHVLGWKAATTNYLLPCDLEKLTRQFEEREEDETSGIVEGGIKKQARGLDASDEILELRGAGGVSSLSPFGVRKQSFKSTASATPTSRGKRSRKSWNLDRRAASKQSGVEEALKDRHQLRNQSQGANQRRVQRNERAGDEANSDEEQEEEMEQEEGDEDEAAGDDEHTGNGGIREESNIESGEDAGELATADTEARSQKRKSSQVGEQISANSQNKRARLTNGGNGCGENTNRVSKNPTASAAIGTASSGDTIPDQATGAILPTNTARGAQDFIVQEQGSISEHSVQTGEQSKEGEADNTATDMLTADPQPRGERDERGSPGSTALSTDLFVESVADGTAFNSLEGASSPMSSTQDCQLCGGVCSFCEVPTSIHQPQRRRMYEYAHHAHDLENKAQEHTLQKWIKRIRYATPLGLLEGQGEVCVLSGQSFKNQTKEGRLLDKPVLIKEEFADSGEWTPARYADLLDTAFADFDVDVRWHQDPEPKSVPVSEMAGFCRGQLCSKLSSNPPNMLNLPDLAGAITPSYLRADRFRLLDLIIERCKARGSARVGKQLESTAFDTASSRSFNLLAWPGAFSGAHVDSNGATWVRNLFGYKLWMFVPMEIMTSRDWDQLAKDSDRWDPGDKARAVVLCPGDVFVMRAGLVHAVQTLGNSEPCLMTGGSFWDVRDLLHILKTQFWIGKNQGATNEPLAYQLAQIVDAVEVMIQQRLMEYSTSGSTDDLMDIIGKLRSLGRLCEDCGDSDDCKCSQEGRRCTPLCARHTYTNTGPMSCMLEERADSESVNSTEEQDGNYVGSD